MKACAMFNEFGTSCEVGIHSLKIAQRFNAGFRLRELSKSRQGRQTRGRFLAILSSLEGLRDFDPMIFPALKRWAIFGSTDGRERDSLRLAS